MLREAIEAYGIETSGLQLPGTHLIDWLAEWGREVRQEQTGLLLLTAHRAKGLEFKHVGVLDGGWNREGRGSDPDEARRLFYVAMTRAKQTLVLAQTGKRHCYAQELETSPHVCRRDVYLGALSDEYGRRYIVPSLRDIDIGYAGRFASSHAVHREIANLRVGDSVQLSLDRDKWTLQTQKGFVVGRMSKAFKPPDDKRCIAAKVLAIQCRNISMVDEEFRNYIKVVEWEVVLPELVFA